MNHALDCFPANSAGPGNFEVTELLPSCRRCGRQTGSTSHSLEQDKFKLHLKWGAYAFDSDSKRIYKWMWQQTMSLHSHFLQYLIYPQCFPLSQPPELPDCGLEARNTSLKCRQLYIFYKLEEFFCVEICHKQKIRWVTKMLGENQLPDFWKPCLSANQPFSCSWIDYTPPFWAGFFERFSVFCDENLKENPRTVHQMKEFRQLKSNPFGQNFESQPKKISTDHLDEFWMLQKKWIIMNPNISPIRNLPPINCIYIYISKKLFLVFLPKRNMTAKDLLSSLFVTSQKQNSAAEKQVFN